MKEGKETKEKSREAWIDVLKGIAMCGVLLIHSGANSLSGFFGRLGTMGQHGVQLFFLLSAYLAFASLDRCFGEKEKQAGKKVVLSWWKKRFVKLLPQYYAALFLYLCFFPEGELYWLGSQGKVTIQNLLAHLLLIHGLFPHYSNSILGIEWYLGNLAIFYIVVPFLYKKITNLEKALCAFLITIMGAPLIKLLACTLMPKTDTYLYEAYINGFWIMTQLPVFMAGIVWYFLMPEVKKIKERRQRDSKLLSCCILFFSIWLLVGEMYGSNHLLGISNYTLLAVWFLGILLSRALYSYPIPEKGLFRRIGEKSYTIYLFHWLFLKLYEKYLHFSFHNSYVDWGVRFLLVLFVVYVLAILIEKIICSCD